MKKTKRNGLLQSLPGLLLAAALLLALPGTARALDDDEFGGYASDTLSIQVGYPGGPYYEKRLFTLSELEQMDVVYADYTFIDNMPSVVIDHVKGVRLADIIDEAGIDLGSVKTFHFWIRDKKESSYTSFSKASLIDLPRYCYYSLPDNFDYEEGVGNAFATSDAQPVDTVMALADDWNRCIAGATFGNDYLNLNSNTRFRLIFGQRDAETHTAVNSAKWVYAIVAEVTGEPAITLDRSTVRMSSGGIVALSAIVTAADPLIAEEEPVIWSSDNQRVATVDEHGAVTAHAKGTAVITAEFHGVSAAATVTVTAGSTKNAASGSDQPGTGGVAASGKGDLAETDDPSAYAGTSEERTERMPNGEPDKSTDEEDLSGQTDSSPDASKETAGVEEKTSPLRSVIGMAVIGLFAGGVLVMWLLLRIRAKNRAGKPKE